MGSKYEGIVMSAGSTSYTFDAENRMVSVSGAAAATFVYDGDGNRVKGVVGGVTTTYIGNYFEWSGSTSTMKKYYYAGGTRVAERKGTTLYWLLSDHLGSTSITATSSGSKTAEVRYKAWGETRYTYGTTQTTIRYTGQREESSLGLYWYASRWYSPGLGRFVSPDSIIPQPGNPQAWDRYAYTYSNPVRNVDPSGHRACEWDGNGDCIRDLDWEPGLDTLKKKKNETPIVFFSSGEDAIEQTMPEQFDDFVSILEFYVNSNDFLQFMEILSNIGKPLYKWTKGTLPGSFEVEALLGFITQFSSDSTDQNIARPFFDMVYRAAVVGFEDGITGELSNWVAIPLATGAGTVCNVAAAVCAGATYLLVANGVTLFMDNVIWAPINNELGIYRE